MVGIVGYGAYVPRYRIRAEEIAKVWGKDAEGIKESLMITEKAVAGIDEDTTTISVEAARNALLMSGLNPKEIGAIYVGSESHPYAVKPTATIVADAIGACPSLTAADTEFACKAGTAGIQMCMGLAKAGYVKNGMAIGADTAQGRPGDALEFTAASGGAAFIIGNDSTIADIIDTFSFTTDTPDFWRREGEAYPRHGARFTGDPAYFRHVIGATNGLFEKTGFKAGDFDYAVFHQPNGKFPARAAKMLGFDNEKVAPGLLTPRIGNTYSGSSMLGLAAVLDAAKPNQRILVTSFGSGAGSDSFAIETEGLLLEKRGKSPTVESYIAKKKNIDYGTYVKLRKKVRV